jgi:hypothetical protein
MRVHHVEMEIDRPDGYYNKVAAHIEFSTKVACSSAIPILARFVAL